VGRGDPIGADGAATAAMRDALALAPGQGTVVVGEGAKDGAPMLHPGELLGRSGQPTFDIAVDPLEGTKACAAGLPGAMSAIAIAERDALAGLPAASWYMEKLIVGAAGRGAIDITLPPAENAVNLAEQLGKPVGELGVVVLDKPRHRELLEVLHGLGARVHAPRDGDVAAGLLVLLAESRLDLLIGVGGTPEGVLSACATTALGGHMQARLAPQREDEAQRLADDDVDLARVYTEQDLAGEGSLFAASGITDGEIVRAPRMCEDRVSTETLVITTGIVQRVIERSRSPEHTSTHEVFEEDRSPAVGRPGR
jgi:fructose-1,6-bisphosphatase II